MGDAVVCPTWPPSTVPAGPGPRRPTHAPPHIPLICETKQTYGIHCLPHHGSSSCRGHLEAKQHQVPAQRQQQQQQQHWYQHRQKCRTSYSTNHVSLGRGTGKEEGEQAAAQSQLQHATPHDHCCGHPKHCLLGRATNPTPCIHPPPPSHPPAVLASSPQPLCPPFPSNHLSFLTELSFMMSSPSFDTPASSFLASRVLPPRPPTPHPVYMFR